MKIAKRTLAIVMAMLMVISSFAVAASAAGTLQDAIDAAADGDVITVNQVNAVESIVINKSITLDLNGHTLNSEYGQPAITVTGGTVTIKNGHVESRAEQYSGGSQFVEALKKVGSSPAAIVAQGANTTVKLENVRAVGSFFRIPRQEDTFVPTGSALKLIGAKAELKGTMLTGSYGISAYGNSKVDIYDATLLGYLDAFRGVVPSYDPETVEMVNAADRIDGYLTSSAMLDQWEKDFIKDYVMDDRAYIYTQIPTGEDAKITIDKVEGTAVVTAEEIEHIYANSDCSYKYVPKFAYVESTGERIALDTPVALDKITGENVLVKYQLEFDLQSDIAKYVKNFYAYVDYAYDLFTDMADDLYAEALAKYDNAVQQVADLFKLVENAGGERITIDGRSIKVANFLGDTYYAIERAVIALGGKTVYNLAKQTAAAEAGTPNRWSPMNRGTVEGSPLYNRGAIQPEYVEYYGPNEIIINGEDGEDAVKCIGTLDKIDALLDEFKAIKGDSSLADQSKWAAYALFLVDNYEYVAWDILDEVYARAQDLYNTITTGDVGEALDQLSDVFGDLKSATGDVNWAIQQLAKVIDGRDKLFGNEAKGYAGDPTFIDARAQLAANRDDVADNVNRLIDIYNNKESYVNPSNFIDGNFVKAYYLDGGYDNTDLVLHVSAEGNGYVYAADGVNEYEITEETEIVFPEGGMVELVPIPEEDYVFVGWTVNGEDAGDDAYFVANDSYALVAVFEEIENAEVTIVVDGNGTVSYEGGSTTTTATVEYDDSIDLTATAASDSYFVGWEVDGQIVSIDATYTVSSAEDTTVTALFAAYKTATINVQGTGSVSYGETATSTTATVAFENSIVLNAVEAASSGYSFAGWKVDGEIVSTSTTYIINEDGATVTAVFAKANLRLVIDGSGAIDYGTDVTVSERTEIMNTGSVTLTAVPGTGYEFLYWVNGESQRILSTEPVLNINSPLSRTVKAVFVSESSSLLTFASSSGTILALSPEGFTDQTVFDIDENINTKLVGYEFKGWGPNGDTGSIDMGSFDSLTNYKSGNSVYAVVGTLYSRSGYAFKVNSNTANKFLVTLKYAAPTGATNSVIFNDNGKKAGNKAVAFGNTVTYTAKNGTNFSYWTKGQNGPIVSLNPKFTYTNIGENADLYAVYNKASNIPEKGAVITISKFVEDDNYLTFYLNRSALAGKTILSTGLVYSLDPDVAPTLENVDGETVLTVASTVTTNDGLHTVSLDKNEDILYRSADTYVCARAFIELSDSSTPVYSLGNPIVVE